MSIARQGSGYLLRFHGLADFTLSATGRLIRCYVQPGTSLQTARAPVPGPGDPPRSCTGGQARPSRQCRRDAGRSRGLPWPGRKWEIYPGRSVGQDRLPATDRRLPAVGGSGGGFAAVPSYPGLRLWPDSALALGAEPRDLQPVADYTSKGRLAGEGRGFSFNANPVRLVRLYVLASPEKGRRPVPGIDGCPAGKLYRPLEHGFLLDVTGPRALGRRVRCAGPVGRCGPGGASGLPARFGRLPAVCRGDSAGCRGAPEAPPRSSEPVDCQSRDYLLLGNYARRVTGAGPE